MAEETQGGLMTEKITYSLRLDGCLARITLPKDGSFAVVTPSKLVSYGPDGKVEVRTGRWRDSATKRSAYLSPCRLTQVG